MNIIQADLTLISSFEKEDMMQSPSNVMTIPQLLMEVLEPQLSESDELKERTWMVNFLTKQCYRYKDIIPGMKR